MMNLGSVIQEVERIGERIEESLEDKAWDLIDVERSFYEDLYNVLKLTHMLLLERLHSEDDGK